MLLLLNIALCVLYASDIMGLIFDKKAEPLSAGSERILKRRFRDLEAEKENIEKEALTMENRAYRDEELEVSGEDDDSVLTTFTVDPISYVSDDGVTHSIGLYRGKKSAYKSAFNDPEWRNQWYMHDYRTKLGPVMDLNVVPVYKMGYTGVGIHVAIVDQGVEMDHPDLQNNLDKELSYTAKYDLEKTGEPTTYWFRKEKPDHGTKCAGVVGMTANNSICGAGMAYNAKIIAINLDSILGRDYINARALAHARDKVDIYSNSWGPDDSGMSMYNIGKLVAKAIDEGVQLGRGGLGSIYTFAAGNGNLESNDNCGADSLVNYKHTIGIAGATPNGKRLSLSESCAALFATTYSQQVVTTDNNGACTSSFSGTSAAVPQASAIIALVLQANKRLTYRDVMHVITMGAEVAPLADNESWYKNGAGFWVSNEFGFGLMNALNMVNWAINWKNVPEKTLCKFNFKIEKDITFRTNDPARVIKQKTDGCQNSPTIGERVFFLEQIILISSIEHRYRGAISIRLKSPRGTRSELLTPRINDKSHKGLREWNLKSVHNWGEDPNGEWEIEVKAQFLRSGLSKALEYTYQTLIKPLTLGSPDYYETGTLRGFTMELHGTREMPAHHVDGHVPRTYSAFRTADGKSSDPLTHKQRTDGGLSSRYLHPAQLL